MGNRPTTVANADIHYGYVTIVSEQEGNERFIRVMRSELQQPAVPVLAPALGGNKYSRKHKSTKRTKKQNSRRNRNRRRYRTRNRR
jgi:hypothetical protein